MCVHVGMCVRSYLIICVMIIIVTSINLIFTHQIFVGMTLKFNKQEEFPLIISIFYPEVENNNAPTMCFTLLSTRFCVRVLLFIY